MLYSQSMNIGFAHYPKTAGHSLTQWFRDVFPDARLVEQHPLYDVNHLPVRESLVRLGLVQRREEESRRRPLRRIARAIARWTGGSHAFDTPDGRSCGARIIGVVREPFEMLVSLFEYWNRYDFKQKPTVPLIQTATTGNFRKFLAMAVGDGGLPSYESFFDVHGPAAANTRLLDFDSLEPALAQVCREFGVSLPEARLGYLNAGPSRRRDMQGYRDEAGTLLKSVHSHYRWYYETGVHQMVKGPAADIAADARGHAPDRSLSTGCNRRPSGFTGRHWTSHLLMCTGG